MKNAIVIGTFPTDKTTENMLISCIKSVKQFNWDIVLISHKALPQHIIEMVDYYIYDRENILEPIDLTPVYWYHSSIFSVQINGRGHIVPITRNMKTAIGLLDILGYGFFYYMESDNVLHSEDVLKLLHFKSKMFTEEKEMILFKIENDGEDIRYESLLFGGKPSFFIQNAELPMEANDIRKYNIHHTLEHIFYASFVYKQHHCLIIDNQSHVVLDKSDINIIANYSRAEVIKDLDEDNYFLWISNSSDDGSEISFTINGNHLGNMPPNGYYYQAVKIGEILNVEINEKNRLITKIFFITECDLVEFNEKGYIKFNK